MNKVINWKQFKVKDEKPNLISGWDIFTFTGNNKPNLIENGWDNFKPYGSGDVIHHKPSLQGMVLQKTDGAEGYLESGVVTKTNDKGVLGVYDNYDVFEGCFLTFRLKSTVKSKVSVRFGATPSVPENTQSIDVLNDFQTYSFELKELGNKNLIIEFFDKGSYEIKDIQISYLDNQHLVVEKTPLGNGFTRIQTWGGNSRIKLAGNTLPREEMTMNWSLYVEDLQVPFIFNSDGGSGINDLNINEGGFHSLTSLKNETSFVPGVYIRGVNTNDNLDFIASDPEIVEAKYPNIKVHMNQENTLMHIKTFGGNDKRKLYGTIGRFPSGTKFQQSIYIENYGPDVYVSGHTGTVERHKIETGYKGWMHFPAWVDGPSWMDFSFGAETPDECLDFKCTLPQIVEGDVPNPELVIQTLDDGREHVRVFGANPDTKLVYDEAGFKGELYSFETEIENQGTHLKMTSTVGDYDKEIGEGTTEVKQAGNLTSSKLEFEIGASDE